MGLVLCFFLASLQLEIVLAFMLNMRLLPLTHVGTRCIYMQPSKDSPGTKLIMNYAKYSSLVLPVVFVQLFLT